MAAAPSTRQIQQPQQLTAHPMGKWGWGWHVHGWDSGRKGNVSTDSVEFLAKEDNEEYLWKGALWWKKEKWTVYTWMLNWRIRSDTFMVHISQVTFNTKFNQWQITVICYNLQSQIPCSSYSHHILLSQLHSLAFNVENFDSFKQS